MLLHYNSFFEVNNTVYKTLNLELQKHLEKFHFYTIFTIYIYPLLIFRLTCKDVRLSFCVSLGRSTVISTVQQPRISKLKFNVLTEVRARRGPQKVLNTMIAPGIRVVRGPDWIWQNQGKINVAYFELHIFIKFLSKSFMHLFKYMCKH